MTIINTRLRYNALPAKTKATSNPAAYVLPKFGLLSGIFLDIRGSIAGTLSNLNPYGKSSIVKRVRVTMNNVDIVDITGPQYHWLVSDFLDDYRNVPVGWEGRSAVAAGTFDISMFLPISLNSRDDYGLIFLQTDQTVVQLSVEFEADATVATGATVTATVIPYLQTFAVPTDTANWPPLNTVHQLLGDTRPVSTTGNVDYVWPVGPLYLSVIHGLHISQATPVDNWTAAVLRANNSDTLLDGTPGFMDMKFQLEVGRLRPLGVIPFDLMGSSGEGSFATLRDVINSARVADIRTVITVSAASAPLEMLTVRRLLTTIDPLRAPGK